MIKMYDTDMIDVEEVKETKYSYAKQFSDAIGLEIEKGMDGGFCCEHYIREKVEQLFHALEIEEETEDDIN